jgi:3',5'-cyclic AMP phosphodiesterase CpdA
VSPTVLAHFDRPRTEERTRLAVLSDLHLSLEDHGTWRVSHRTEDRLEAAVRSVNDAAVDGVVFVGDLVQRGARAEFEAFDDIVAALDPPLVAVPGNHDLFDPGTGRDQLLLDAFEERYTPGSLPFRERIGGLDVVGLNSNASTRTTLTDAYAGRLTSETLRNLPETVERPDATLVAVHHTLEPARRRFLSLSQSLPGGNATPPDFESAAALADVLAETGVPLVITGHLHVPLVVQTAGLREFTLPSLGPFPCGYTILDVDETGTTATFQPIGSDRDRAEALGFGLESARVLLAGSQIVGAPLEGERGT